MAGIFGGLLGGLGLGIGNAVSNAINNMNKPSGGNKPSTGGNVNTSYTDNNGNKKPGYYNDTKDDNGERDYSKEISNAIQRGESAEVVQGLLDQRTNKANSNSGLSQYANDDFYKQTQSWISQQKQAQQQQNMENFYAEQAAAQEAAMRAKIDQSVGNLTAQKGGVNQSYEDLMRQLYIDRRRAEKNLPQQMAAMGHTGGLTESTAMGMANSYQEALQQGERERINTLSDIDRAIEDTKLTGEISLAEQASQMAKDKLSSYTDLLKSMQAQQNWETQFGYQKEQDAVANNNYAKQLALSEAQAEFDRTDTTYGRKLQLAAQMAEWGDFSGYAALGIDPGSVANTYAAQLATEKSSGSSGGGYKAPSYNKTQYDLAIDLAKKGNLSDEVRAVIEGYSGFTAEQVLGVDEVGRSRGFAEVSNTISKLEDSGTGAVSKIANAIINARAAGTINDGEMQELLSWYNIRV